MGCLKGNIFLDVFALVRRTTCGRAFPGRRGGVRLAVSTPFAPLADQLHVLQNYLHLTTLLPFLVLPSIEFEATLNEKRVSFSYVFRNRFCLTAPSLYVDKRGLFLPLRRQTWSLPAAPRSNCCRSG